MGMFNVLIGIGTYVCIQYIYETQPPPVGKQQYCSVIRHAVPCSGQSPERAAEQRDD